MKALAFSIHWGESFGKSARFWWNSPRLTFKEYQSVEIIIGIAAVVALILVFGQMSLDKPVNSWSDEELVRRLPKYQHLLSTQAVASSKAAATNSKIAEIRAEMVLRQKAFESKQAEPLRQESLSDDRKGSVITEKAMAAAEAGELLPQVVVGLAYLAGANGLPQDPRKASTFLLKAAMNGHPHACFVVAGLFAEGIGLPQNFDHARTWAVQAKSLGAPDADQMIASIDAMQRR